jgi:hypothetical protein
MSRPLSTGFWYRAGLGSATTAKDRLRIRNWSASATAVTEGSAPGTLQSEKVALSPH